MQKFTFFNRILLSLLGIALISVLFAGCFSGAQVNNSTVLFKVMTYNIHHAEGADGKLDLLRIAGVIERADCDIVGLQEVDNNFSSRSEFFDQIKWLAKKLEMHYVFAPAISNETDGLPQLYGNAILSKNPIIESETYKLYSPPGYEQRVCLKAIVRIGAGNYTFMVTHLDHKRTLVRVRQVNDIIKVIPDPLERTVLMGDFNCRASESTDISLVKEPLATILEKFTDSVVLAKTPPNESFKGVGRIDYIFVSPDLSKSLLNYEVIKDDITVFASDHLPVTVEIQGQL